MKTNKTIKAETMNSEEAKSELLETSQKLKSGFADVIKKVKPSPASIGLASVEMVVAIYRSFKDVECDSGMKAMVNATRDALKIMEADQSKSADASAHAE